MDPLEKLEQFDDFSDCKYEERKYLTLDLKLVSFVFGRNLLFCQLDGRDLLVCAIDTTLFFNGIFTSWDMVLLRETNKVSAETPILFGCLSSKFKYKNTRTFHLKLFNCVLIDHDDIKVFEKCVLKFNERRDDRPATLS